MSFDDYTKKIIESVYGKDVRQAIYDALVYLKTNMAGTYTLPAATAEALGGVMPDATQFTLDNGKLTLNPYGVHDIMYGTGCWFHKDETKGIDFSLVGRLAMISLMQRQFFTLSMPEAEIPTTDVTLTGYSRLIDISADYNSDLYELFGQKVSKGIFIQHGGYQNDSDTEPGYAVQMVYPARKSGQLDTEANTGFAVRRLYFGASESDASGYSSWELYKPAVKCVTDISAGDSFLKITYSDGMISNIVSSGDSAPVDISDSFGTWGDAVTNAETKEVFVSKAGNLINGTIVVAGEFSSDVFNFNNGGESIFTIAEQYKPINATHMANLFSMTSADNGDTYTPVQGFVMLEDCNVQLMLFENSNNPVIYVSFSYISNS